MKADRARTPVMGVRIDDTVWDGIAAEYTLPSLEQVRARLEDVVADPEPVLRGLIRVFIGDGTFFPGFQFRPDGTLHPVVADLFTRALELDVPHNYFSAWIVTPSTDLAGHRPVDMLQSREQLLAALEVFAHR